MRFKEHHQSTNHRTQKVLYTSLPNNFFISCGSIEEFGFFEVIKYHFIDEIFFGALLLDPSLIVLHGTNMPHPCC